jgi:hypothetical protein
MEFTKDQWYKHPDFRRELEDLFRTNRTLQIALAIVKQAGLKPTPTLSGIDLMHFFALQGSKRDGYFEAIRNLEDLSQPLKAPQKPDPKPWKTQPAGPDADITSAP